MDSGYRSCQYDRGLWGHDAGNSARQSYTHLKYEKGRADTSALHPAWPTVYKELKQHEKSLRNHNMYMGPLSAFADLFDMSRSQKYSRYDGSYATSAGPRYWNTEMWNAVLFCNEAFDPWKISWKVWLYIVTKFTKTKMSTQFKSGCLIERLLVFPSFICKHTL